MQLRIIYQHDGLSFSRRENDENITYIAVLLSPAVRVNIDPYSCGDNQTSYFTVFFFLMRWLLLLLLLLLLLHFFLHRHFVSTMLWLIKSKKMSIVQTSLSEKKTP